MVNTTRPRNLSDAQHPHMATRYVGVLFIFFRNSAHGPCYPGWQNLGATADWPLAGRLIAEADVAWRLYAVAHLL
jgi:hypothetical protein